MGLFDFLFTRYYTLMGQRIRSSDFGWLGDPLDTRDLPFSGSALAAAGSIVSDIDLTQHFRPVSDQLALPSCVANATADLWEAAQAIHAGISPEQVPDLSRMFLWWNARNEMNPNRSGEICGTHNRLAMDVVARHGVCTETRWPYDPAKSTTRPSIMSYREAYPNRCDAFYCIGEKGSARVDAIIRALSTKHPVLFGTLVDEAFLAFRGTATVHKPSSSIGGHAMVICGWSSTRQAFRVRNSWTAGWGDGGYWWMGTDYVAWGSTHSIWVPTKGAL